MTDPNYTALLLIVDRSGSMTTIRDDMVGGLQTLLADQAAQPGLLTVDIVVFDTQIEHTHSMADPRSVIVTLEPRGGTALYDAIGVAVNGFGQALASLPEHSRPGTVRVVIVTDGEENSSVEYSLDAVRGLIEHQTQKYGWDFVFLGANQDAVLTARGLGISADSAMTYIAAPDQVLASGIAASRYVSDVRRTSKKGFTLDERDAAGGAA